MPAPSRLPLLPSASSLLPPLLLLPSPTPGSPPCVALPATLTPASGADAALALPPSLARSFFAAVYSTSAAIAALTIAFASASDTSAVSRSNSPSAPHPSTSASCARHAWPSAKKRLAVRNLCSAMLTGCASRASTALSSASEPRWLSRPVAARRCARCRSAPATCPRIALSTDRCCMPRPLRNTSGSGLKAAHSGSGAGCG
mmetsp:Transcript_19993/g.59379  ORF Transcript_19993/g.59379 Transcript_19993/m.59379 type:complete len:202 (+) Transcript_19993:362-967(+)